MTKWCPKLPVLAFNLPPIFPGGWTRWPEIFPGHSQNCACFVVESNWFVTILFFFSCPWSFIELYLKEITSVNLSVWAGTLYTENGNHFWTNKSNHCLLTFEILKNPTRPLFKKNENQHHIYCLTVTYLVSLPELPTSSQLWSHFYTNYTEKEEYQTKT